MATPNKLAWMAVQLVIFSWEITGYWSLELCKVLLQ